MLKDQLASFLTLHHVFGLGRASLISLSEGFDGDFNRILNASRGDLRAAGLNQGQIEMGHARALLALDKKEQKTCAQTIVTRQLSVRAAENLVKQYLQKDETKILSNKQADPDIVR